MLRPYAKNGVRETQEIQNVEMRKLMIKTKEIIAVCGAVMTAVFLKFCRN
jgi:hypothetical protein